MRVKGFSPVVIVVPLLVALALALPTAPASASPSIVDFFGSTGSGAGQFAVGFERPEETLLQGKQGEPGAGGVAVDDATGDVYVVDRSNNRIEQFDSEENFIRTWGVDVISGGATGAGNVKAESAEVTAVLTTSRAFIAGQEISGAGIPPGTTIVKVTSAAGAGSKLTLSQKATANGTGVELTAAEGTGNVPQNEKQTISISAGSGDFKLAFNTTMPSHEATTGNLPSNASTTSVQSALEGLSNIGAGNVAVAPGPAGGPYAIEFKGTRFADTNVAQLKVVEGSPPLAGPGKSLVTTTQEGAGRFEKCTVATTCQAGTATGIAGGMATPNGIAVEQSSGNVYVSDQFNLRVDEFDSSGTFIRAFGGNVVESGPDNKPEVQKLTVDADSGTFTLKFEGETTAALPFDVPAFGGVGPEASVENALNALASIGKSFGSVSVEKSSSGPSTTLDTVTFEGALANQDVGKIELNANGLGAPVGTELPCSGSSEGEGTVTYQWLRNGEEIGGANSSTYTTVEADKGKLVQCKVKADSGEAASVQVNRADFDKKGSVNAVMVSPFPATTPPVPPASVSVSPFPAKVGQTLTCEPGSWGPASPAPTLAYQWLRNGAKIGGATASTYVVQAVDNQTAIQCEVSGTNAGGTLALYSGTAVIRSVPPTTNVVPTISGTATKGSPLECGSGGWSGAASFAYQWLRNGAEIDGANSSTYTTIAADEGTAIQCMVTATNSEGSAAAVSADKVIEPAPSPLPPSGTVSVEGEREVGKTLTCQPGSSTPASPIPTFTYQWLRNGEEIGGANSSTYTTGAADLDKLVQCRVTATNSGGSSARISPSGEPGRVVSIRLPGSLARLFSPSLAGTITEGAKAEICSAGSDLCRVGVSGGDGGVFAEEEDSFVPVAKFEGYVAIAPGGPYAGDVFVGDSASSRIQIFDPSGAFVGAFGRGVLQSGPETAAKNVCLAALGDTCGAGERSERDGHLEDVANKYGFPSPFRSKYQAPIRFAVGPDGSIYVASLNVLQKYSPDLTGEHDFATGLCSNEVDAEFCQDVAVDPHGGDVYVAVPIVGEEKVCVPQGCFVMPVPKELTLARYDAAGDEPPLETTLTGAEVRPINGIAIDGSVGKERSGRVYFSTAKPEQRVDVLGEPTPPDVELDKVNPEKLTPHSATVTATINPNGNKIHTLYRFETLVQGGVWTQYPVPSADAGNGTSPVAIETTIPGLLANTEYRIRLTAIKGQHFTTPEETFTTPQAGPDVETGGAQWSGPPETKPSLTFTGQVDDNSQEAHYYFEYGADASYGKRVPFFETGTHPASQEAFTARQTVPGLDPEGTYHYRLIARTTSGTTVGADREVGPPETARRYPELVSPAEKGPARIGTFIGFADRQLYWQAAASGNRMTYGLQSGTLGASAGGEVINLGVRDPSAGWQSSQLTPPSLTAPARDGLGGAVTGYIQWQSPELSCDVVESLEPLSADSTAAEVEEHTNNLFWHDQATGTYIKISAQHLGNDAGVYSVAGGSADCSRVVFETEQRLLPGLPAGQHHHLYEWEDTGGPNGTLRSADVLPNEAGVAGEGRFGSPLAFGGRGRYTNAVSEPDASRVFFSAGPLFVRKNHASTVEYSKSQTATPNNGDSTYEMASADGSHVFFTARAGLAVNGGSSGAAGCSSGAGQGCDLYDYDVGNGGLTDLTPDANPADKQGAAVSGVLGASNDGSYVYFAAKGQLIPGEGRTFAQNSGGFNNVYLAHEGALSFVGSVAKTSDIEENIFVDEPSIYTSRVTPDGRFLIFVSELNLTGYESEGAKELYRYSAPEEALECVSCRSDGLPPQDGEGSFLVPSAAAGNNTNEARNISADGGRVFFNSAEALAPGAVEGEPTSTVPYEWRQGSNAYEWHNGTIHLLAAQGRFTDASVSGNDVFLITDQRLVPQDQDGAPDIYDMRIDGGFPYSPPEPCDPLTENSCQGTPPPPPPPTPDPASVTADGPGNPPVSTAHHRKPKKHHKKRHKHKHKSHKRAAKRNRGGVK